MEDSYPLLLVPETDSLIIKSFVAGFWGLKDAMRIRALSLRCFEGAGVGRLFYKFTVVLICRKHVFALNVCCLMDLGTKA